MRGWAHHTLDNFLTDYNKDGEITSRNRPVRKKRQELGMLAGLPATRGCGWEARLTFSSSSSLRWLRSLWCCSFICSMTSSASMLIFRGLHSSEPSPGSTRKPQTLPQVLSLAHAGIWWAIWLTKESFSARRAHVWSHEKLLCSSSVRATRGRWIDSPEYRRCAKPYLICLRRTFFFNDLWACMEYVGWRWALCKNAMWQGDSIGRVCSTKPAFCQSCQSRNCPVTNSEGVARECING